MSAYSKPVAAREARIEVAFQLELAVGTSHIASMLHVASRTACIDELVQSFVRKHGSVELGRFLIALADRLDARGNNNGASAVRCYTTGSEVALPAGKSPRTDS